MRAAASSSSSASALRWGSSFTLPRAAMRDPQLAATTTLPRIEDAVKAGGFLTGTPADIVEQLKAVEKRYPGVDRVVCATPLGTPLDIQLEDLDRFAKEVMPAFGPAKIDRAAAES